MIQHRPGRSVSVFALAAILLPNLGCSDTVIDPFNNDGHYFTIYGFLDLRETNHEIRVIPVRRTREHIGIVSDPQSSIDATVYTTDLTSGERVQWNHTLSRLSDGSFGHVFRASFLVHPQHTYRLEVVRSDGVTAFAETTVPYIAGPTVFEKGPVIFSPDSSEMYQDIHIPEISSPWQMDVAYLWGALSRNYRADVAYERAGERAADGGWNIRIHISRDQPAVRSNMRDTFLEGGFDLDSAVGVHSMGIRVHVLDQNWDPPGGLFDPEVLAVPGTMSNVENGYGFFGSVGVYQELWNIQQLSPLLGYDF